jgi:uncharacterized protein (DUF1697 family)
METYISMLRGINVSGHNMIKMDLLKKMYAALKYKNIQSYIQSGNIIFQTGKTNPKDLEKKIAKKIVEEFGFEIPVLVKTQEELSAVLQANPFIHTHGEELNKLHITFLSDSPEKIHADKVKDLHFLPDEFFLSGDAVYLYCPNGYGQTKLNNNFFENKLKVKATTRNWKTLSELSNMASGNPVNKK